MPNALVILSPGFEEVEAITVIDLLRRAAIDLTVAGLGGTNIIGSHNISVTADTELTKVDHNEFDILILPGGQPGTNNMKANPIILQWLRERNSKAKWIAAICAAPIILHAAGIADNLKLTSYPTVKDTFDKSIYSEDNVVVDKNIITSRGVGTAIDFSLAIISKLIDQSTADDIKTKIVFQKES